MTESVDVVTISASTATALSTLGIGDFVEVETPERMASVALILRGLDDRPDWFPRGKWATIQHVEAQLRAWAAARARDINYAKMRNP